MVRSEALFIAGGLFSLQECYAPSQKRKTNNNRSALVSYESGQSSIYIPKLWFAFQVAIPSDFRDYTLQNKR